MIRKIENYLYVYQNDDNSSALEDRLIDYYSEKGLNRRNIIDDLPYIEKGALYKLWIVSIPYEYNHWGDIFTDYEDRIVYVELTELIDLTNILSLFDKI